MTQLFKLINKYRPESRAQKKERLQALAEKKTKGEDSGSGHKKPVIVKYGIHHVTSLVEQKKAQLVIIAHDVDPIEVRLLPMGINSCRISLSLPLSLTPLPSLLSSSPSFPLPLSLLPLTPSPPPSLFLSLPPLSPLPSDCCLAASPLPKDECPLLYSERESKVQNSYAVHEPKC